MPSFQDAAQSRRFTITADLTLKGRSGPDDVARQADLLGPWVDGLQVTDNPWAWVQMSASSAAALLLREGIDPIAILTCRDRNRIALQSDLLGLRALGVSSVLLMRGHKVPDEHPVKASTVFDISGRELLALAARIGESAEDSGGQGFYMGTGARAFRPSVGWDAESLNERSRAGARFLQTQLCFNLDILRQYMKCLVETRMTWKYSVMVSLTPLPSLLTAQWLKQNLSDSRIPKSVLRRLEQARDAEQEGIAICAELMQQISEIPGVSGVNLMTTGSPELLVKAIKASGLRE